MLFHLLRAYNVITVEDYSRKHEILGFILSVLGSAADSLLAVQKCTKGDFMDAKKVCDAARWKTSEQATKAFRSGMFTIKNWGYHQELAALFEEQGIAQAKAKRILKRGVQGRKAQSISSSNRVAKLKQEDWSKRQTHRLDKIAFGSQQ